MRRFFFLSVFCHGALLLLLFSWEIPLADKFSPKRIIEVSLIEKIEEKKSKRVRASALKQRKEVSPLEKKEALPPPEKKEEKKEEKKDPPPAAFNEEKAKEEKSSSENKPLMARLEQPGEAEGKFMPPAGEGGSSGALQPGENLGKDSRGKGGGGKGQQARLGAGSNNPGPAKGGGPPAQMGKIPASLQEVDPTLLLIIHRIEAVKRYPKMARKMGIEGTVVVRFKLKPGGQVEAVEVMESSGYEILDKASLETVRDASPFPYKEGWLKVGIVFKIL
jgi:protein TonB